MFGNRKEAMAYILKYIDKILPDGRNKAIYEEMFKKMSDKEFHEWMMKLDKKEEHLHLIAPNAQEVNLKTERNLEIAKEIGHKFFQRLWTRLPDNSGWTLSHDKYMVIWIPVRRQAQHLEKKSRIPVHNRSIDQMTSQPTGDSKGSKISYPEVQMLAAMGLDKTLLEFIKFRGGDVRGYQAMEASIARSGQVSLRAVVPYESGVTATKTLGCILTAMHLTNNIAIPN